MYVYIIKLLIIIIVIYRLRQGKEQDRDATLAALVCRTFRDHTMIFVRTKADAHRVKILLGLFGLKVKKIVLPNIFISL